MKKFFQCFEVQCYPSVLKYEQQQPLFQKAYVEYQQCAQSALQAVEQATYNAANANAAFIASEDRIHAILEQCAKSTHMYLDEIIQYEQCQLNCLDQTVKSLQTSAASMSLWAIILISILGIVIAGIAIFYMVYRYHRRRQSEVLARVEQLTKSSELSNRGEDKHSIVDYNQSEGSSSGIQQEMQQRIIIPSRNKKKQYKSTLGGLSRLDINKMKRIVDHLKMEHPTTESVDSNQVLNDKLEQKVDEQPSCLSSSNAKENCHTIINVTPNCGNTDTDKHAEMTCQVEHKSENDRLIHYSHLRIKRKRHFSVTQSDRSQSNMSQNMNQQAPLLTEQQKEYTYVPESEFKESCPQIENQPELRRRLDSDSSDDKSSRLSDHLSGSLSPSEFLNDANSNMVIHSPNCSSDNNNSSTQLNQPQSSKRQLKRLKFISCNNSSMISPKSRFARRISPDPKQNLLTKKKSFDFPAFEYQAIQNEKDKKIRLAKIKTSKSTQFEEQQHMVSRIRGELLGNNEPRRINSPTGSFQQFIPNPIISQSRLDSSLDSVLANIHRKEHADQDIGSSNKNHLAIQVKLASQSSGLIQ